MTFYQELQLNQAGSKSIVKSSKNKKEKIRHLSIYIFKVVLTTAFCAGFMTLFTMAFGSKNGVAGVSVLLALLAFRQVNLGFHTLQSAWVLFGLFAILAIGPHAANRLPLPAGFAVNVVCILSLLILGCHNIIFCNHATFLLSYLLLYGNDVSGREYGLRVLGLMTGGLTAALCLYRNHRNVRQKRELADIFREFSLESTRSQWQIKITLAIAGSVLVGELLGIPRTMWIGIAAMSVLQPFAKDRKPRVKYRFLGTAAGCLCFFVLVSVLPKSAVGMIGIIGGIGVGFCATYKWQTVFNAFGALAVALPLYGLSGSIALRIFNNGFAILFVLMFSPLFDRVIRRPRTVMG